MGRLFNTRSSRREEALDKCGTRNAERGTGDQSLLTSAATSLMAVVLCLGVFSMAHGQNTIAPSRFSAVEIFVDSGVQPLAAYQLTFTATTGGVKIVGIEGGEHPAFKEAPHYDPKAIQHERAILAAFNTATAENLPKGRTRVATVHVQISGTTMPAYTVRLETAANHDNSRVTGQTSFQERSGQ